MRTFHQVLVSHAAYTIKTPFIIWLHFLINFHTKIYSITSYGISDEHDFIRHKLVWNRFTSLLIDKRACSFSILFFWVIPTSKYLPSGFAGHLLINKEAYPIPILPVRIPFLNTVANLLLALWMTPYRISSFWTGVRMLYENEEKSQHDTERRIYYTDDALPSYTRIMELAVRRSCWRT